MKHNLKVISILILLYLLSQYLGLYVSNYYLSEQLPYNLQRGEFDQTYSFLQIFVIMIIATILILVLTYYKAEKLWSGIFFLSVVYTVSLTFSSFLLSNIAFFLGIIGAYIKVFNKNFVLSNIVELFIYPGLGAIFVPILNLYSVSILLVLISVYDMVAVWYTKHMIKIAKFHAKAGVFPGFLIPYGKNKHALLGGGDVGFPLLFSGVVLANYGLFSLIVPLVVAFTLFLLFYYGEKSKYYPAMPFLSLGCFVGLILVRFLYYVF